MRGAIRSGPFELGYAIEGEGAPALVIGSAVYYPRTFSQELRRKLKLIFVDHRGFAKPDGEVGKADFAFDRIIEDIELVRQNLGLGKVIVIGHSGHGYMALEYARRYPQHISHVVVIATGPSQSAAHAELTERNWREAVCPERKARLAADIAMLSADIAAAPEKRFISFCIRLGARSWFDPDFDAAPLWDGVHVNMDAFDHIWGEVFRDIDIRAGLDKLDAPVFLALGRFDYLVAPAFAWEPYRADFRDLTVRIFDHSGHTPQLEEAPLFDRELLGWLEARACA